MRKAIFLAAAMLLATFASVGASQGAPLTLRDAVAAALQNNSQYRAAELAVGAAQDAVLAARARFGPSAALSYSYGYQDHVARLQTPFGALPFAPNATQLPLVALHLSLYDGGSAMARFGRADAAYAQAQAQLHVAARATVAAASRAYYALVAARADAAAARRALALARADARLARERFDVGTVPRSELLAAQVEVADRRVATIEADNAVALAQSALDAVMGIALDTLHDPIDGLPTVAPTGSLPLLIARARATRPELAAARDAVDAAQLAVREAHAGALPQVGLTASEGNVQPIVESGFHPQFTVALNAVWTLFDGGYSRARVAAARSAVASARLGVHALSTRIELEVRRAFLDATAAQARVAAAATLVRLAKESLRLAEVRYRAGVGTALELRAAEVADARAHRQRIAAGAALAESDIALDLATGTLHPPLAVSSKKGRP